MAWVAVDEDGTEWLYTMLPPYRTTSEYLTLGLAELLESGSIEKLIGRKLTWENDPVELPLDKRNLITYL